MRLIQAFEQYPAIHRIFGLVREQEDAVFLDSSLQNQLGRYSIIGLSPYLKLVKRDEEMSSPREPAHELFTVNGQVCGESCESWTREYLRTHREEHDTSLPLVSGAIGYFSYDYGRKKEGVVSRHPRGLDIPDCVLVFYDNFILEDHRERRLYLIANDHRQRPEEGIKRMTALLRQAQRTEEPGIFPAAPPPSPPTLPKRITWTPFRE